LEVSAELVLKAAFPEYFAGTHVLLPREPSEEMLEAAYEAYDYDDTSWREFYGKMISAYESTSTSTEEK